MKLSDILDLVILVTGEDVEKQNKSLENERIEALEALMDPNNTGIKREKLEAAISEIEGTMIKRRSSVENFIAHKANLSAALRIGNRQPSVSDYISIISDIVGTCSKLYESYPQSENLDQIRSGLITFLGSEEGIQVCKHEHTTTSLNAESAAGVSLLQREISSLRNRSLLSSMMGSVVTTYNQPVINFIVQNSDGLENRPDLVLIMVNQHTISSSPDMSETFDLMVRAGIPHPSYKQLEKLLTDDRPRSGRNASKLALSFVRERDDHSLVLNVLNHNYNGSDRKTRIEILGEKEDLKKSLISRVKNVDDFIHHTRCLIELNNDDLLKKFLRKHAQEYVSQVEDHSSILQLAIDKKMIKTFDLLTDAGFDVLRKPEGTINPFALACREQGDVLEEYLRSIRKKFGQEHVERVVSADDNAAVTNVIEGRGYVDVLTLLERNGADLRVNYGRNLRTAATKNRIGILNTLIEIASDDEVEKLILDLQDVETSYVTDCILLDRLTDKNGETAQSLKQGISQKESSLKEEDFFHICQFNGGITLKYFLRYMEENRGYQIEDHVNQEHEGKRPLYYAINNRAYNSLVESLLEYGANPNLIASNLDAATLSVRNKESGTLRLLLESDKLSASSIESAFKEMKESEENTLITKAFLEGVKESDITKLAPRTQFELFKMALDKPELSHCLEKFSDFVRSFDIGSLLIEVIEESNPQKLETLFQYVPVKSMIQEESTTRTQGGRHVFEFSAARDLNETTPLVPSSQIKTRSSNKLTDLIDKKYIRTALEMLEQNPEDKQKESVLKLLIKNDFSVEGFDKRLKALRVIPKECKDYCCTIS